MDEIWRRRLPEGRARGRIRRRREQGRLVHATHGLMRIMTPENAWMVTPHQALWIAPDVDYELHPVGSVTLRDLRVEPDVAVRLWPRCRLVQVSPLLRELILGMWDGPSNHAPDSDAALIAPLLLHKLRAAELSEHGKLPLPRDARLMKVCAMLMDAPGSQDSMARLADRVGTSVRTLNRLFKAETGLTFGQWRTQLRLTEAVCQLALGQPVGSVARGMGYATANAFSAMFRRTLGAPPQRYLRVAVGC